MATNRIESIDKLRGLVMIIMALDHVRDFFHITAQTADPLDLATTTPALFFTRWITHFCAPVFVFLSGSSAYLSATKKSPAEAGLFLIKRGCWLALADLVLISFALSFNPQYNFVMLTVIWAIGISMILLGVLVKYSPRLILPIGLILFLTHDFFTTMSFSNSLGGGLMKILFQGLYIVPVSSTHIIAFLYSVLPWTSVMLLGYAFGKIINQRRKVLLTALGFFVSFLVLRLVNIYGDPAPWKVQGSAFYTFMSFINTSKYPPSLQFLCMTLAPALLLLSVFQQMQSPSRPSNILLVYGRTPFFYYVLHLFLAHLILVGVFFATGHTMDQVVDKDSPFFFRPKSFGFDLPVVYACWFLVVALLYFPCRWYSNYKRTHRQWWLSYL